MTQDAGILTGQKKEVLTDTSTKLKTNQENSFNNLFQFSGVTIATRYLRVKRETL